LSCVAVRASEPISMSPSPAKKSIHQKWSKPPQTFPNAPQRSPQLQNSG
jgi:hypothetical protein